MTIPSASRQRVPPQSVDHRLMVACAVFRPVSPATAPNAVPAIRLFASMRASSGLARLRHDVRSHARELPSEDVWSDGLSLSGLPYRLTHAPAISRRSLLRGRGRYRTMLPDSQHTVLFSKPLPVRRSRRTSPRSTATRRPGVSSSVRPGWGLGQFSSWRTWGSQTMLRQVCPASLRVRTGVCDPGH